MQSILLSFGVFLAGLVVAYSASRRWNRRVLSSSRSESAWWWGNNALWTGLAVFAVAVTISDIGLLAVLIGVGVSLVGWGMCTWGLMRSFDFQRGREERLQALFAENLDLEKRFYSSGWITWLLPKRKDKNPRGNNDDPRR